MNTGRDRRQGEREEGQREARWEGGRHMVVSQQTQTCQRKCSVPVREKVGNSNCTVPLSVPGMHKACPRENELSLSVLSESVVVKMKNV